MCYQIIESTVLAQPTVLLIQSNIFYGMKELHKLFKTIFHTSDVVVGNPIYSASGQYINCWDMKCIKKNAKKCPRVFHRWFQ